MHSKVVHGGRALLVALMARPWGPGRREEKGAPDLMTLTPD